MASFLWTQCIIKVIDDSPLFNWKKHKTTTQLVQKMTIYNTLFSTLLSLNLVYD